MPRIKYSLAMICLVSVLCGCSSVNTSNEEELMSLDGGEQSESVGNLEDEIDAASADGEQDFSSNNADSSLADSSDQSFGESDFSEDFGEESFDDGNSSGSDDFGSGDFSEDDFEQAFAEEGNQEQSLQATTQDDFAEEAFGEPVPQEETPFEEQLAAEDQFAEPLEPAPVGSPTDFGPTVEISNIKFLANQNGGTVIIDGTGPLNFSTRVNAETNQFIIEINNSTLPSRLKRPYILKEFPQATFGAINAYQDTGSSTSRVVLQMKNASFSEPTIQAEGNSLIVIPSGLSVDPMLAESSMGAEGSGQLSAKAEDSIEEAEVDEIPGAESVASEQQVYDVASANADEKALGSKTLNEFLTGNNKFYGNPISIQVKDADIRDILNFISEQSGTNMIISDTVKGTLSLKLREIPWDQALVTVMKAKGLGYVREGSVVRISTLGELEKEAQDARRIVEAQKTIEPLKVKVIPVSFAKVDELTKQIQPFLSKGRGSSVFDERTSSLIITDTDDVLKKAERLVQELDVAPAQVIIEGKIVEAVESFNKTLGINWSASGSTVELSKNGGLDNGPINLSSSLGVTTLDDTLSTPLNFNVQVGALEFLGNLNAQLRLAETDELVNIISSPRVVAMNKQKAKIEQNTEVISLSSVAEEGVITTTVNRTPVIVSLEVVPQITADGSVIMDIVVKREFAGAVLEQTTLARPINKRIAETRVLVKNGATAVIGGMYNSSDTQAETGVPLLKKIPVIGWLFKSRTSTNEKNELLIFLTPRILNLQDQSPRAQAEAA